MIYQIPPAFNPSRTRIVSPEGTPEASFALWMQALGAQAVRAIPTASTFAEIPIRTNYSGEVAWITDSDTDILGAVIAGGGAFTVLGLWDGTDWVVLGGVGVGAAPAGSDTDIQFNDNGAFGGASAFHWDQTLSAAALGAVPASDIRFYVSAANATASALYAAYADLTISGTGSGTPLSSNVFVVAGANISAPPVQGVAGGVTVSGGSVADVTAVWADMSLEGGTVSAAANTVYAVSALNGGTVGDLFGVVVYTQLTAGTVTNYYGMKITVVPAAATPSADAYGLLIQDQTVAGVAAAKNWALRCFGPAATNDFGVKATGIPAANGLDGVSGTFTTADAKTVTVTNGLITAIV